MTITPHRLRVFALLVLILSFIGVPVSYACWDITAPDTSVVMAESASQKVQSVDVVPDSLVLDIGDGGLVTCQVFNRPNKRGSLLSNPCNWKSWDTTVATVVSTGSQSATVVGKKIGRTSIVAGSSGKRDSAWVRVSAPYVPPTSIRQDSVHSVPSSWNAPMSAWNAFGVYFTDSVGGLYGKDTLKLAWTCPAGGASKCPSQQFCPIAYFNDGVAGLPAPYRSLPYCTTEYGKLPAAQRALTPVHVAILDTLCTKWTDDGQNSIGHEACDGGPSGTPGLHIAKLP